MTKFKKILQDKQTPTVKSVKTSMEKQRDKKIKDSMKLLHETEKNNLKQSRVSNEVRYNSKDISTNIQNNKKEKPHDSKNKLDAKCRKNSNVLAKYQKDCMNKSEVSQKMQVNTNINTKRKKENIKQKKLLHLDVNKEPARVQETTEEIERRNFLSSLRWQHNHRSNQIKQLEKQMKILSKNRERKIKKLMKISETKETLDCPKILKLNKNKYEVSVERWVKLLTDKTCDNKLQLKQEVAQPTLRDRLMTQLKASRFRFINKMLYDSNSLQSKNYFQSNPDVFMAYHMGYKQQIKQWPINPLDVIIASIKKLPTNNVIADFGCGEARLVVSVPHTVHSFDFIALNGNVTVCDMAHTPLRMNCVHVVVFCLSLMGSNLNDYIIEANRVLQRNGILKIAEVESRFKNVNNFIRLMRRYGFQNTWKDLSHNVFYFMDFKKIEDISMEKKKFASGNSAEIMFV